MVIGNNITDISKYLSQFKQNQAIYNWEGTKNPEISESEDIIFVLENNFALYENHKLNKCLIIFTSERTIITGIEVKGTLVGSMVSREVEERRGSTYKPEQLSPQVIKGWDISHNNVTKLEIIKTGRYYSLFFFRDEFRLCIINDVKEEEMNLITSFLTENYRIETIQGDFQIPISDILLLIGAGIGLTIIGWIIIVIIF